MYKDDLEYVHSGVTNSPLKVHISPGAFQNSDSCRGQSNLVLFVFILRRGGRKRREGKEGEGREGGRGRGRRGGELVLSQHNLKMVETNMKGPWASVSHPETSVRGMAAGSHLDVKEVHSIELKFSDLS